MCPIEQIQGATEFAYHFMKSNSFTDAICENLDFRHDLLALTSGMSWLLSPSTDKRLDSAPGLTTAAFKSHYDVFMRFKSIKEIGRASCRERV